MSLIDRAWRAAGPYGAGIPRPRRMNGNHLSRRATGGLLQDGAAPQRRAVWFLTRS